MIKDGFAAPFVRLFYQGRDISANVTRFRYVFDEEETDEIELTVEVENPAEADQPYYQEEAELQVIWGYIGEQQTNKRKIYIREPRWQFGRDNIVGTLTCTEKAVVAKSTGSKRVFKNKTFPQIVDQVSKENGLKAYLEVPGEDPVVQKIQPRPGESLDKYLIREANERVRSQLDQMNKNPQATRVLIKDVLQGKLLTKEQQQKKDLLDKYERERPGLNAHDRLALVERDLKLLNLGKLFEPLKNVPQANKSDMQLIKELGDREKDGPWVVETRDDEVTVKKRNFNKTPYKTYTYGGSEGELLEFNPESKKRGRAGSSTNVGFSGWNKLDKTFFSGSVNSGDGSPSLTKAIEMRDYYKGIQSRGGGTLITGSRIGRTQLPFINNPNVSARIDNSGDYRRHTQRANITVDDQVSALDKAINEFQQDKEEKKKELYNALGINPESSFNMAANGRRKSELRKNQVTALVWGDVNLVTGLILTFEGLSKKYIGNYYVIKATHTIEKNSAYEVELELARHGHNTKVNENYADHKDLGRTANNKVGPKTPEAKKKPVPVKTDPPKVRYLSKDLGL